MYISTSRSISAKVALTEGLTLTILFLGQGDNQLHNERIQVVMLRIWIFAGMFL
jgi:hypothetical protein